MGLFTKKEDVNFRVISHDFLTDEIAYKYEYENFNTSSILFVKPGQEAILVLEGQMEVYTNGRYELNTNTVPIFRKFISKHTNNVSIYKCYIYFINKDKAIRCYWGTPTPIQFYVDKYQSTLKIVARGSYTLIVNNSQALLARTIGQLAAYKSKNISDFIFDEVIQLIVTQIATAVQKRNILFTELASETVSIADEITKVLEDREIFEAYGFRLKSGISIEILKLHDDCIKIVEEADAIARKSKFEANKIENIGLAEEKLKHLREMNEAEVMKTKGIYYDKERTYDVLELAAKNEGGAKIGDGGTNIMTTGIGLSMGMEFGKAMTNAMHQVNPQPAPNPTISNRCTKCGSDNVPTAKFCNNCGSSLEAKCPSCGFENIPGAKFCNNCGIRLM